MFGMNEVVKRKNQKKEKTPINYAIKTPFFVVAVCMIGNNNE